jgi:hypothetical protein
MRATKSKNMHTDKFTPLTKRLIQFVRNAPREQFLPASFLGLALLLAASFGCAPPASTGDGRPSDSATSGSSDLPEITDETIRERINNAYLRDVPEENGAGEPINWSFDEDEPKEIRVVEKKMDGDRATIVLDIKTRSSPRTRNPRELAGQIRTKWKLQTGWAMRKWEIIETENVSMKYKNLPKPPAQNSNR